MGMLDGRVALITGAGRGLGRAHALRLAEEGADIVALDLESSDDDLTYPLAGRSDLDETARLVTEWGRRAIVRCVDVRDQDQLLEAVAATYDEFGRLDVVVPNAGIVSYGPLWELSESQWQSVIDVNLTGVWHTLKATVPRLISADNGGSIIIVGSLASLKGLAFTGHYSAAKHGLVGMMRSLARELGPHRIRVNAVHPFFADTPMAQSGGALFALLEKQPQMMSSLTSAMGVDRIPARETSNAVLWLASDESQFVTGANIPVDAGAMVC